MKRSLAMFIGFCVSMSPAAADIPVIDKTNYAVARQTADTTSKKFSTPTRTSLPQSKRR